MTSFAESVVEDAALAWLEGLGWEIRHGPAIAAGEHGAERGDPNYRDVLLERRLRQALVRLNPDFPPEAQEDTFRKLTRVGAPSLVECNRAARRALIDRAPAKYRPKGLRAPNVMLEPMLESVWRRNIECGSLIALRDAMLPTFVSGDLRLADAEKFIARAAS